MQPIEPQHLVESIVDEGREVARAEPDGSGRQIDALGDGARFDQPIAVTSVTEFRWTRIAPIAAIQRRCHREPGSSAFGHLLSQARRQHLGLERPAADWDEPVNFGCVPVGAGFEPRNTVRDDKDLHASGSL